LNNKSGYIRKPLLRLSRCPLWDRKRL